MNQIYMNYLNSYFLKNEILEHVRGDAKKILHKKLLISKD